MNKFIAISLLFLTACGPSYPVPTEKEIEEGKYVSEIINQRDEAVKRAENCANALGMQKKGHN